MSGVVVVVVGVVMIACLCRVLQCLKRAQPVPETSNEMVSGMSHFVTPPFLASSTGSGSTAEGTESKDNKESSLQHRNVGKPTQHDEY